MQMHPTSNMRGSLPPASTGAGAGLSSEFQHRRPSQDVQLPPGLPASHGLYREAFERFHRKFVLSALHLNGYNQVKTAAAIGVHRNTLTRWLDDLGVLPAEDRKFRCKRGVRVKRGAKELE